LLKITNTALYSTRQELKKSDIIRYKVRKSTLFDLARWLNSQKKVLPEEVITRAPSAELSDGQKDEDSLPPYEVLDSILMKYCDENKSAKEIIADGFDTDVVEWVINQYNKTSYKREQMPKVLSID